MTGSPQGPIAPGDLSRLCVVCRKAVSLSDQWYMHYKLHHVGCLPTYDGRTIDEFMRDKAKANKDWELHRALTKKVTA